MSWGPERGGWLWEPVANPYSWYASTKTRDHGDPDADLVLGTKYHETQTWGLQSLNT